MSRLRVRAQGAASALIQSQRWRSFYGELKDPTVANLLDHHLTRSSPEELSFIRPLRLYWSKRYDRLRTARAFIIAAGNGLCRASWLVTCSLCLRRSVHACDLSDSMYCFGCRQAAKRSPLLPCELVFSTTKGILIDGLLRPDGDVETLEALCDTKYLIPKDSAGFMFARAVSRRLRLTTRQGLSADGPPFAPPDRYSVALEDDGPDRVNLDATFYPGRSLLVRPGAPIVVRNASPDMPLLVNLSPCQDTTRICEATAMDVPEYADLFF